MTRQLVVVLTWPDEPDRGTEVYGPFADERARDDWVTGCEDTRQLGRNRLLNGVHYLLTVVAEPFDPWDVSPDIMRLRPCDAEFGEHDHDDERCARLLNDMRGPEGDTSVIGAQRW